MDFTQLAAYDDIVRAIADFLPHRICTTIRDVETCLDSGFPYEKIIFQGHNTILSEWLELFNSRSLKLKSLKELTFRVNTDEHFCTQMVEALTNDKHINLKRLVLSATFNTIQRLKRCLQHTSLALDATFEVKSIASASQLQELIETNPSGLKAVTCHFRSSVQSDAIMNALKCNTRIEGCQLSHCRVSGLAEMLRLNHGLRHLNLSYCKLGDEHCKALAQVLIDQFTLETLDLQGNNIQGAGADSLSHCLERNTKLLVLHISQNSLGPDGGRSMAKALFINRSLLELHLQLNSIGASGREAMSDALKVNKYIKKCFYYD